MEIIRKSDEYNETINFDREKEINKNNQFSQKVNLEKEKMQNQVQMKQMEMDIAKQNKNKYDVGATEKPKNKKKK
jgi:hypothetical protein